MILAQLCTCKFKRGEAGQNERRHWFTPSMQWSGQLLHKCELRYFKTAFCIKLSCRQYSDTEKLLVRWLTIYSGFAIFNGLGHTNVLLGGWIAVSKRSNVQLENIMRVTRITYYWEQFYRAKWDAAKLRAGETGEISWPLHGKFYCHVYITMWCERLWSTTL
jgi:hypothetical protein